VNFFLQLVANGIVVGGIYAMVALGFVLIYKSSRVNNFAQGEFLMIGAYASLAIMTAARVPPIPAFLLTLGFAVLLALLVERLVLRPLIGEPVISVIMVTFGLASVLRAIVQLFYGTDTRPFPELFSPRPIFVGPIPVAQGYLYGFLLSFLFLGLFFLFFKFTAAGVAMRATAFDQVVALSMGVSVKRIFALAWGIAAVVSATGGIILGSIRGGIDMGLGGIGLKVIPVALLGGLDSVPGAILGGLIIGVLENLSGGYLDPIFGGGVKEVAPFVVLVLILMIRPYGLFGTVEEIERV
jgi:branched-chain amino acid transport system permease protein